MVKTAVSPMVTQKSSCDSFLETRIAWNLAQLAAGEFLLNQSYREFISSLNTIRIVSTEVPANEDVNSITV